MGWARLDDGYPHHPKMLAAGADAIVLDVAGVCYANRYQTDGWIADTQLTTLYPPLRNPRKAAQALVDVGRWTREDGGWRIHDFLDYNGSKADRDADRQAARERMAASRTGKARSKIVRPNNTRTSQEHSECSGEVRLTPLPVPVVPTEQERAREANAVDNHPAPEPTAADRAKAVAARQDLRRKFRPNDVLTGDRGAP